MKVPPHRGKVPDVTIKLIQYGTAGASTKHLNPGSWFFDDESMELYEIKGKRARKTSTAFATAVHNSALSYSAAIHSGIMRAFHSSRFALRGFLTVALTQAIGPDKDFIGALEASFRMGGSVAVGSLIRERMLDEGFTRESPSRISPTPT